MSDPACSDRPPSGLRLLFHPAQAAPIPWEQRIATREAAAYAAGATAAHEEAAQRIAAQQAEWASERAATETAHAKALAALETTHRATIAALDDALADALPPLALAVARALLAVEPSPHIIAALSAQAISALPPDSAGTLRIAPGQPLPQVPGWTVLEDASLPPATVRAELDCTRVTASLAGRLEQIARELSA